jgi:hypothetical protein
MKSIPQFLAVVLIFLITPMSRGASYTNSLVVGYHFIANQLNGTNNHINTILPGRTDGDTLQKWNAVSQSYFSGDAYFNLGDPSADGWYDSNTFPSATTLNPGEGAVYQSQVATNIIFSGTQGVPNLPRPYQVGYALVSRQIPGPGTFENIMGFAPVIGAQFNRFNPMTQLLETNTFNGTVWTGGVPAANVGEAVFVFLPMMAPVVITQQPVSQTTTDGQPVTFRVSAGPPPLAYQWLRNGLVISNALTNSYFIPSAPLADNGAAYSVVVANSSGSVTSTVATLTVNADSTRPTVVRVSNTPNFMQVTIKFSERVTGNSANNSANYSIPGLSIISAVLGADGSNVTLTVTLTEGSGYTLSIANIFDLASSPNLLQPNPTMISFQAAVPPMILEPPNDRVVSPGDPVTLAVSASGTAPLSFQWYRGNSVLSNETASELVFTNVQPQHIGSYYVVVMNSAGAVTSAVVRIGFLESYTLDLPAGYSAIARQLVDPNVPFPPVPNLTQVSVWRSGLAQFEDYIFSGGNWLPTPPVLSPGGGAFIFLPSPASLTFSGFRVPSILPSNAPTSLSLISAPIPVAATYDRIIGSPPQEGQIVYRYKPGGDPTTFDQTNYHFSYFREGGWHNDPPRAAVGESLWVGFIAPVVITTQPLSQTNVTLGQPVMFSVGVTGSGSLAAPQKLKAKHPASLTIDVGDVPPVHYQWLLNGAFIPDATNSSYMIPSVSTNHAGLYNVVAGNLVGDVASQSAGLTLNITAFNMTDSFDARETVTNFSRVLRADNRNATLEPGEPMHAGKRASASVWLTWHAITDGIMTMSTEGSGLDTILAAYTGNSVSALTSLDADDDSASYSRSRIAFNAIANTPYQICVAGLADNTGDIVLGWEFEPTTEVLPKIIMQPEDLSLGEGATAQFTVVAINGTFTYQWYRNGEVLAGATAATLTLPNLGVSDVAFYFVRVSGGTRFRDSVTVALHLNLPLPGEGYVPVQGAAKFFDLPKPLGGSGLVQDRPPGKLRNDGPADLIGGTVNRGYGQTAATALSIFPGRESTEPLTCLKASPITTWYALRAETNGTMCVSTRGTTSSPIFYTQIAAYSGLGDKWSTLKQITCDDGVLEGRNSRLSFAVTTGTTNFIQVQTTNLGTLNFTYRLVRPLIVTNFVYNPASGGRVTMRIIGTSNLLAQVQYSAKLNEEANWITVTNFAAVSGIFNYTNNGIGNSTRFYRAINSL